VATSSIVHRRWLHRGRPAHHLIDPRTGAPAKTDLLSVTVAGSRLPDVEIEAKTALILGREAGLARLAERPELTALLVTEDGSLLTSGSNKEIIDVYYPIIFKPHFIDR
jgi:thiamine biosynthesis lipoprotein